MPYQSKKWALPLTGRGGVLSSLKKSSRLAFPRHPYKTVVYSKPPRKKANGFFPYLSLFKFIFLANTKAYKTSNKRSIPKLLWLAFALLLSVPAFSQNTKGDKPARSLPKLIQKSKPKKTKAVKSVTKDISGRRLRTKNKSTAARAIERAPSPYKGKRNRGDRASKPVNGTQVVRSSSARAARSNIYPSDGPYVNNPSPKPRDTQKSFSNSRKLARAASLGSKPPSFGRKRRIAPRSASRSFVARGRKNVYWGKFSKGEKAFTKDISGRPLRAKNFHTTPQGFIPQGDVYRGRKRSGDRPYKGTFRSGFATASKPSERAWRGDVSGRPIRKNSSKKRIETAGDKFYPREAPLTGRRNRVGQPLLGSGYRSRTRPGESRPGLKPLPVRAPGKGASRIEKFIGSLKGKRAAKGGGSISGRTRNNRNQPIAVRMPTSGAQIGSFSGNLKARRPGKGGGSISGQARNNRNQPIAVRTPVGGAGIGSFSGTLKARRPDKGGGSISGQARNNRNQPIAVRTPTNGARIGSFSGTLKAKRPDKGGGSISGRPRNNRNEPIVVRTPTSKAALVAKYQGTYKRWELSPGFTKQGIGYTGDMKTRRPEKGGGSISGRARNNKGNPIDVRMPPPNAAKAGMYSGNLKKNKVFDRFQDQGEAFTGFIKAKKPVKGGGSISGHLWNNKGTPIVGKSFPASSLKVGAYKGKMKAKKPEKGGGSVSGKLWNNKETPIPSKAKLPVDLASSRYSGTLKQPKRNYIQNPNANKNSLKKEKPDKTTYAVAGLHVKVKEHDHEHNKLSTKDAIDVRSAGKNSVKASEYEGKMRRYWSYSHNPSSSKAALNTIKPKSVFAKGNEFQGRARLTKNYRHNPKGDKDALKVIAPGRAYARINNYQGNSKMSKPHGKGLHPDAKFAHDHNDNVKSERTIFTNVKLWWSKLFKKNDTQPTAVKEKVRRPRYDKKERDLWKDLYD